MDLEEEHRLAIRRYTFQGHRDINLVLRGGGFGLGPGRREEVERQIPLLDDALERHGPLEQSLETYRGIDPGSLADYLRDKSKGAVFVDDAFVSTSLDRDTGREYATRDNRTQDPSVLLQILVPAGFLALPLSKHSALPNENEVLLPRGTVFRVLGYTDEGPVRVMRAGAFLVARR